MRSFEGQFVEAAAALAPSLAPAYPELYGLAIRDTIAAMKLGRVGEGPFWPATTAIALEQVHKFAYGLPSLSDANEAAEGLVLKCIRQILSDPGPPHWRGLFGEDPWDTAVVLHSLHGFSDIVESLGGTPRIEVAYQELCRLADNRFQTDCKTWHGPGIAAKAAYVFFQRKPNPDHLRLQKCREHLEASFHTDDDPFPGATEPGGQLRRVPEEFHYAWVGEMLLDLRSGGPKLDGRLDCILKALIAKQRSRRWAVSAYALEEYATSYALSVLLKAQRRKGTDLFTNAIQMGFDWLQEERIQRGCFRSPDGAVTTLRALNHLHEGLNLLVPAQAAVTAHVYLDDLAKFSNSTSRGKTGKDVMTPEQREHLTSMGDRGEQVLYYLRCVNATEDAVKQHLSSGRPFPHEWTQAGMQVVTNIPPSSLNTALRTLLAERRVSKKTKVSIADKPAPLDVWYIPGSSRL